MRPASPRNSGERLSRAPSRIRTESGSDRPKNQLEKRRACEGMRVFGRSLPLSVLILSDSSTNAFCLLIKVITWPTITQIKFPSFRTKLLTCAKPSCSLPRVFTKQLADFFLVQGLRFAFHRFERESIVTTINDLTLKPCSRLPSFLTASPACHVRIFRSTQSLGGVCCPNNS